MIRRIVLIILGIGLATAGFFVGRANATTTPTCQIAYIQENSGNGPNYPIRVCNSGGPVFENPGKGKHWDLIVDGGALPEHNHRIPTVVIAEVK